MSEWKVYILRCSDNSLYTGITLDIHRRLNEHNHNDRLASAYTRARRPVELVYHESHDDRASATQREIVIKKLTKVEKEKLINEN